MFHVESRRFGCHHRDWGRDRAEEADECASAPCSNQAYCVDWKPEAACADNDTALALDGFTHAASCAEAHASGLCALDPSSRSALGGYNVYTASRSAQ